MFRSVEPIGSKVHNKLIPIAETLQVHVNQTNKTFLNKSWGEIPIVNTFVNSILNRF